MRGFLIYACLHAVGGEEYDISEGCPCLAIDYDPNEVSSPGALLSIYGKFSSSGAIGAYLQARLLKKGIIFGQWRKYTNFKLSC
ncbi:hypothetical protein TorRG33x02_329830 [Trema orientale]|uniref:Uncharacterized protein n=1 Tax=Trema orientale TaxID=63057 RepID=A0A2P5B8D2_TREOI|nr:hypothetical protein TorRG33x02_329830 [Trema orientale]